MECLGHRYHGRISKLAKRVIAAVTRFDGSQRAIASVTVDAFVGPTSNQIAYNGLFYG